VATTDLAEISDEVDENEYLASKRFKQQYETIQAQNREIRSLKGLSTQLEETTSQLPNQVAAVDSRAAAAEGRASSADARAGQALGAVDATNQKADELQKQLGSKLGDVETRASRAADQAGQAAEQASRSETRTEALEKELDRRARQVEARTEELGDRTTALQEREERLGRMQRATLAIIVADLTAEVETLDNRVEDGFYKSLAKGAVAREAKTLNDRINAIEKELKEVNTEQANQFVAQLETIKNRLAQVATKAK
jgi:chromosome segregation ATPase